MNSWLSINRLLATARGGNWWSSKLQPLLALAYLVCAQRELSFRESISTVALVGLTLVALAWFAHVVNDVADVESDRRAQKTNQMDGLPMAVGLLLALMLLATAIWGAVLTDSLAAQVIIVVNALLFVAYSTPPVRLKSRRWIGAIGDTIAVHVLPTLFVLTVVPPAGILEYGFITTAAVWASCSGLRGILFHQLDDRPNDLRAGLRTVATTEPDERIRRLVFERLIPVEAVSLALFALVTIQITMMIAVALVLFATAELLRVRQGWRIRLFDSVTASEERYRPFGNNEFYEFWLPIAAVLALGVRAGANSLFVVLHSILFMPALMTRALDIYRLWRDIVTRGLRASSRLQKSVTTTRRAPASMSLSSVKVVVGVAHPALNGVNVFSVNLIRGLRARGVAAHILTTEGETQLVSLHEASLPFPPDVPVEQLPVRPWESWGAHWGATVRYLSEHAPCVYIPNSDFRHSCVCPILPNEVAVIGVVHSDDPVHYDHVRRLGCSWNAVVAVNDIIAGEVSRRFPALNERIATIPIGARVPSQRPLRHFAQGAPLRIIYHGALKQHQKRVLDLPLIAEALCALGTPAHVTIAGSGPDEGLLRAAAKPLVDRGIMTFAGVVPHEEVPALLTEHDVYLLVSDFEGLPNALVEAMAVGCVPVVSQSASHIVIDGVNGISVATGDINGFAQALRLLQTDVHVRRAMSEAASDAARALYNMDDMITAWHDLLSHTIQKAEAGQFKRTVGEISPPPANVGNESVFPVALPYRVDGTGSFASEEEWLDFVAHFGGDAGGMMRSPKTAPTTTLRYKQELRIVFASPFWTRNGVNILTERLVRGLLEVGVNARLLLTEERTDLVTVDDERLPRPSDFPVDELSVSRSDGWGIHWGAMQQYLETNAPCIYLPTFDWRHSCVLPRCSSDVIAIAHVQSGDPLSLEHARRLGPYLQAVVVNDVATARIVRRHVASLVDRIVMIPEGRRIPDRVPSRQPMQREIRILIAGISWQVGARGVVQLRAALRKHGISTRITVLGSADHPEWPVADSFMVPDLDADIVDWPASEDVLAADAIVSSPTTKGLPGEVWEAIGAGCIPIVVGGDPPRYLRNGENCYLVNADDIHAIAERIASLALDSASTDRIRARAHDLAWRGTTRMSMMIGAYRDLFARLSALPQGRRRPTGSIRLPPRQVDGVNVFPIATRWWVPGVGRFPSLGDFRDYRRIVTGKTTRTTSISRPSSMAHE